jgi:hypothetical protein
MPALASSSSSTALATRLEDLEALLQALAYLPEEVERPALVRGRTGVRRSQLSSRPPPNQTPLAPLSSSQIPLGPHVLVPGRIVHTNEVLCPSSSSSSSRPVWRTAPQAAAQARREAEEVRRLLEAEAEGAAVRRAREAMGRGEDGVRERERAREAEQLAKMLKGMKDTGKGTTEVEVDGERLVYITEEEGEAEGGKGAKATAGKKLPRGAAPVASARGGTAKAMDEKAWSEALSRLEELERLEAGGGGDGDDLSAPAPAPATAPAPAATTPKPAPAPAPARAVAPAPRAAPVEAGPRAFTGRVLERTGGGAESVGPSSASAPPAADSSSRPLSRFARARLGLE